MTAPEGHGGEAIRARALPTPPPPPPSSPAEDLHAWLDRAMGARIEAQGLAPACRRGCSDCCRQAVGVHAWEEARLVAAAAALPAPVLAGVRSRLVGVLAAARTAGVLDDLSAPWPPPADGRLRWRRLGAPCPLVDPADGACLIWPDRPAVCRLHNVLSGPAGTCDTPGALAAAVPYADLLGEAGRLAGPGRRWLPAALAALLP